MNHQEQIKRSEEQSRSLNNNTSSSQEKTTANTVLIDQSERANQGRQLQELANNSSQEQQGAKFKAAAIKKTKDTNIPAPIKAEIEALAGVRLDNVNVHYNSDKPLERQTEAYTEGFDIYLAPNSERYLTRELWVVARYIRQKESNKSQTQEKEEQTEPINKGVENPSIPTVSPTPEPIAASPEEATTSEEEQQKDTVASKGKKKPAKTKKEDTKDPHESTPEEENYGTAKETTDLEIDKKCAAFKNELDKKTTEETLIAYVQTAGKDLWTYASKKIQDSKKEKQDDDNWNDRALYRARLKMRLALKDSKNHLLKGKKNKLLPKLIHHLEQSSRGMTGTDFPKDAAKKILITGFDPFQGGVTNPSGIVALHFDGKTVGNAAIQSAVFPVRYEDFDNGMVEGFFGTRMSEVDAIITVSQTGFSDYIDIDRFSANVRGEDNNKVSKTGKISEEGDNFYESSLPQEEMLEGDHEQKDQKYAYRQNWSTDSQKENEDKYPKDNKGNEWNSDKKIGTLEDVNKAGEPSYGSNGDYLSNEIHYRVSKMRTENKATKNMPQGHLHINNVDDKKTFMKDVETLISRVVATLNKKK